MKAKKFVNDFSVAVLRLKEALSVPSNTDLLRAGCIQYFEFCFELAWKSIKAIGEIEGLNSCQSPRRCLKQAFSLGWIDDEETWLAMLAARNQMSHTYNAEQAGRIYDKLPKFLPALQHLSRNLQQELEIL